MRTKGCAGPAFDVFAHQAIDNTGAGPLKSGPHRYDASTPDLGRVVNVLRAAERVGALPGSHPVWVTEFWWDSNPPNSVGAPLDVQARWVEQTLYLFWKAGASAAVNFQIGDMTDRRTYTPGSSRGSSSATASPSPLSPPSASRSSPSGSTNERCAPGARLRRGERSAFSDGRGRPG